MSLPAPAADPAPAVSLARRVALLGNPNTGKTTVFNRLCGTRAKTANFPGTTATMRVGRAALPAGESIHVLDLPGLYELAPDSSDSQETRALLRGSSGTRPPDALVVVVDATNLARGLALVGEAMGFGAPVVVCLNMTDLAARRGVSIDAGAMADRLGTPVVPTVASRGAGMQELRQTLEQVLDGRLPAGRPGDLPGADAPHAALARWSSGVASALTGSNDDPALPDPLTERLDRALTHPVTGTLVFLGVMGTLFWTLFALATVPMALIEGTFSGLGGLVEAWLPEGAVRDLLTDGVIGGIAGTVVFLPQIMLLFFLISLLEDTGYLARAAFVNDRFFSRFGLPGQAFVPLLTAHACAIPGIMSTRLIPNPRDRLATILVLPFMSCSARLPVYVLLTSLLFADRPGLAGLAFAGCYVLGAAAAFGTAAVFGRTALRGRPRPMVLELPAYKRPSVTNALFAARDQGLAFLATAGTTIFAICVVMWWLSAYPRVAPPVEAESLRVAAAAPGLAPDEAQAMRDQADLVTARAAQAASYAGRLGRFVQPAFAPLGYDWQLTDGLLTSFLAREVFVSTMSVLAGAGPDPGGAGVISRIRTMTRDDGTPVFTPATSASALVFFVLAMQCLATLAVTRRETGRLRYAAVQLGYMTALAWVAAFVVYQSLRAFGVN